MEETQVNVGGGEGNVKLPSVSSLFNQALGLFGVKFWRLVTLGLIQLGLAMTIGSFMAFFLVVTILSAPTFALLMGTLMVVLSILVSAWLLLGMLSVIHEDIRVGVALGQAFKSVLSYFWLTLLLGLTVAGGFIALGIPGMIFAIWFSLSLYVFVVEGKRGMDALIASKEYIRGYWWPAAVRFSVLALVVIAFALITDLFGSFGTILNMLFNVFFIPFSLVYGYLLYNSFTKIKPQLVGQETPNGKRWIFWTFMAATVALILMGIIMVASIGLVFPTNMDFNELNTGGLDMEGLENLDLSDLQKLQLEGGFPSDWELPE